MEDIEEVWEEITLESARFILEQAEKRLQATINTADSLTDRAVNVMQFSIPLTLALVGVIIAGPRLEFLWLYVTALVASISMSFLALHLYDFHDLKLMGRQPKDLLNQQPSRGEGDRQYLNLILNAIRESEIAIEKNNTNNQERQRLYYWIESLVKFLIAFSVVYIPLGLYLLFL